MKAWIASVAIYGAIGAACSVQGVCDFQTTSKPYCDDGAPACTGHEWDETDKAKARKAREGCCAGRLLDDRTWESGPIHANWLTYDGQAFWAMHLRDAATGAKLDPDRVSSIDVFLASDTAGGDATLGAGNLSEAQICNNSYFCPLGAAMVRNDTCASYFVRVVVHATAPGDAGADGAGAD